LGDARGFVHSHPSGEAEEIRGRGNSADRERNDKSKRSIKKGRKFMGAKCHRVSVYGQLVQTEYKVHISRCTGARGGGRKPVLTGPAVGRRGGGGGGGSAHSNWAVSGSAVQRTRRLVTGELVGDYSTRLSHWVRCWNLTRTGSIGMVFFVRHGG
jgi:hypothetical protein